MKLLYIQIFAAATSIGLVGAGAGLMSVSAAKRDLERKLAKAELDAKNPKKPSLLAPKTPGKGRDLEKENAELAQRVRTLEGRIRELERENQLLKEALKKVTEPAAVAGTKPQGASGSGEKPLAEPMAGPVAPPLPVAEGGAADPWGASEDNELDEMTACVKLNPEQREAVRKIILDGQNDFERRLIELSQTGGTRNVDDIEKIGEEVSKGTQAKIEQILFLEQKPLFQAYMKKKEEPR